MSSYMISLTSLGILVVAASLAGATDKNNATSEAFNNLSEPELQLDCNVTLEVCEQQAASNAKAWRDVCFNNTSPVGPYVGQCSFVCLSPIWRNQRLCNFLCPDFKSKCLPNLSTAQSSAIQHKSIEAVTLNPGENWPDILGFDCLVSITMCIDHAPSQTLAWNTTCFIDTSRIEPIISLCRNVCLSTQINWQHKCDDYCPDYINRCMQTTGSMKATTTTPMNSTSTSTLFSSTTKLPSKNKAYVAIPITFVLIGFVTLIALTVFWKNITTICRNQQDNCGNTARCLQICNSRSDVSMEMGVQESPQSKKERLREHRRSYGSHSSLGSQGSRESHGSNEPFKRY